MKNKLRNILLTTSLVVGSTTIVIGVGLTSVPVLTEMLTPEPIKYSPTRTVTRRSECETYDDDSDNGFRSKEVPSIPVYFEKQLLQNDGSGEKLLGSEIVKHTSCFVPCSVPTAQTDGKLSLQSISPVRCYEPKDFLGYE